MYLTVLAKRHWKKQHYLPKLSKIYIFKQYSDPIELFNNLCYLFHFFIYNAYKGKSFKYILQHFTSNLDDNDMKMIKWYIQNDFYKKFKQISILDSEHINNMVKKICETN